jgi:hypothetical protein
VPRYLVRLALERLASLLTVVVECIVGVSVVAIGGGLCGRGGGLLFILLLLGPRGHTGHGSRGRVVGHFYRRHTLCGALTNEPTSGIRTLMRRGNTASISPSCCTVPIQIRTSSPTVASKLALAVGLLMRQRPFPPGALLLVGSETGELLR